MKVHQILSEADTPRIARAGRGWKVTFPDGTEQLATSQDAAASIARDWSAQNAPRTPSAADDIASRTRPDGRIEPSVSSTSAPETPNTSNSPELRADARPGTPTSNQLTAAEHRKLSRGGRITRGGVTYTAANIAAADADLHRARTAPSIPGETRPSSNAPAVDDAAFKGKFMQALGGVWNSKIGRFFRGFLSAKAQTTLMTAFNVMVLEDVLDAYLRSIRDYGASLNDKSQAERDQFTRMIVDGDVSSIPPSVQRGYLQAIEQTTKVFVEAVIGLILTLGWAGIMTLGAFGIATGGLGILASIAAGGAFVWGGTALVNKILEEVGVIDAIENWVATELLSPVLMFRVARGVDGWQEYLGVGADVMTGGLAGDLIRDDINEEAAATDVKVDPKAAENAIKDLVRSNPKLMKAYRDGKEEAKAEMRSTTRAS